VADCANLMEWVIKRDGPVATIKFDVVSKPLKDFIDHRVSLALVLEAVRFDDTVRVVVITERDDGPFEPGPTPVEPYPHEVMNPATRPGGPSALKRDPGACRRGLSGRSRHRPAIGRQAAAVPPSVENAPLPGGPGSGRQPQSFPRSEGNAVTSVRSVALQFGASQIEVARAAALLSLARSGSPW
jgi:hypothetical protein